MTTKTTTYKAQVNKFIEQLEQYGEMYFSTGSAKTDYEHITSVLDRQGYWSATEYRLYFNKDLELTEVQDRWN